MAATKKSPKRPLKKTPAPGGKKEEDLVKEAVSLKRQVARLKKANAACLARQESEEWFKAVFDNASDSIIIYKVADDGPPVIANANRAACEMNGVPKVKLLGRPVTIMGDAKSREKAPERIRQLQSGRRLNFESSVKRPDGTTLFVEVSPRPMTVGGEKYVLSIARDITERKAAEQALKESESRFRGAFESAAVGASVVDLLGRFVKVNRHLCDLLGYKADELVGKTFSDVTHPEDVRIGLDYMRRMIAGEMDTASFEKRYIRKNGEILYLVVSPSIVRDGEGRAQYFVGLFQDITERKLTEAAFLQSEAKYRNIFDSSTDAIIIVDMEGNLIDVNNTACERLGYTKEELLLMHISQLDPPEFAAKVPERLAALRRHGKAVFESAHVRKDGSVMPVEVSAKEIDYEGRKVLFSIVRDITERKIAEEKIKSSLREKEVLLREVHHRVKNNMAIISALLQLQTRHYPDSALAKIVKESQDRINSMALVHEKLYQTHDFSRISINSYCKDLIKHVLRSYKAGKDIDLRTSIEEISFPIDVLVPFGLILNELITNSVKYAFEGAEKPIIEVLLDAGDGTARFTYSDNGVGIPASVPFPNTNSLGLQIINMLVLQIRGTVELDRSAGTKFTITFPYHEK